MTRWIAGTSTCSHRSLLAGWFARTMLILALSGPPWPAGAQEKDASPAESASGAGAPEWKRLQAEVDRLDGEGHYKEAITLAERAALLAEKTRGAITRRWRRA
jgi:hypothetical protein